MYSLNKQSAGRSGYAHDHYYLRIYNHNSTKILRVIPFGTSKNPDKAIEMYNKKIEKISHDILLLNDKIKELLRRQETIRQYVKDKKL